jgi:hypothetical protein
MYIYHIALMHTYADQLHRIGRKLVMLGDETWIKLFPTLFARHDGVSSFYVSLFYAYMLFLQWNMTGK